MRILRREFRAVDKPTGHLSKPPAWVSLNFLTNAQRNKVRIKGYREAPFAWLECDISIRAKAKSRRNLFSHKLSRQETTWDDFLIEKAYFGIFMELNKHAALRGITWNHLLNDESTFWWFAFQSGLKSIEPIESLRALIGCWPLRPFLVSPKRSFSPVRRSMISYFFFFLFLQIWWTALSVALGLNVRGDVIKGVPCVKKYHQLFCPTAGNSYPM